jgi:hypothetical protein
LTLDVADFDTDLATVVPFDEVVASSVPAAAALDEDLAVVVLLCEDEEAVVKVAATVGCTVDFADGTVVVLLVVVIDELTGALLEADLATDVVALDVFAA